ncbi:MAG: cytochrome d ubiquinol oxidase subunit II [Chloroflexi bacterium]|nr:MAG: cytochrome d ubiquinol oxidase subunit II [Chloroflexota bacterium]
MITLPYILLAIIWFALIAYAVFGGADFGAGVWDLLAFGPNAEHQHKIIDQALGPVWETNHVWLVFLVVGLFSAFPAPFAVIVVVLFIPLTLALIGTVLRGAAFIFRTHGLRSEKPWFRMWSRIFSFSSVMTPFFLGLSAAAVASGQIRVKGTPIETNLGSLWLTPFSLTIGLMAVTLCATLAAIFLTVEATNNKEAELAEAFRLRGLVAGALTALLGAIGLLLSSSLAPFLWNGMIGHALPLVIATMLIGLAAAATLFFRYYAIARVLIVAETAFILGSWGVSQIPYLLPPDVTVDAGAGAPSTLLLLLIGIIIGMALVLPSMWFLFYIFKLKSSVGLLEKGR